nr:hypothetical protein [Tanacetum cinerariifolium]
REVGQHYWQRVRPDGEGRQRLVDTAVEVGGNHVHRVGAGGAVVDELAGVAHVDAAGGRVEAHAGGQRVGRVAGGAGGGQLVRDAAIGVGGKQRRDGQRVGRVALRRAQAAVHDVLGHWRKAQGRGHGRNGGRVVGPVRLAAHAGRYRRLGREGAAARHRYGDGVRDLAAGAGRQVRDSGEGEHARAGAVASPVGRHGLRSRRHARRAVVGGRNGVHVLGTHQRRHRTGDGGREVEGRRNRDAAVAAVGAGAAFGRVRVHRRVHDQLAAGRGRKAHRVARSRAAGGQAGDGREGEQAGGHVIRSAVAGAAGEGDEAVGQGAGYVADFQVGSRQAGGQAGRGHYVGRRRRAGIAVGHRVHHRAAGGYRSARGRNAGEQVGRRGRGGGCAGGEGGRVVAGHVVAGSAAHRGQGA